MTMPLSNKAKADGSARLSFCWPRNTRIRSSVENWICVFRRRSDVQISDVYPIKIHICKWLRSDVKKSDLGSFDDQLTWMTCIHLF